MTAGKGHPGLGSNANTGTKLINQVANPLRMDTLELRGELANSQKRACRHAQTHKRTHEPVSLSWALKFGKLALRWPKGLMRFPFIAIGEQITEITRNRGALDRRDGQRPRQTSSDLF